MKLYKKAAACLLTAAMALSMLTACGGGTPNKPGGGTPNKPGGNTPSTLPTNPDEIVLPDIGEGGGEGTETKPTKTLIDVSKSKLAQFNKRYADATEFRVEMQQVSYDEDGSVAESMDGRAARKGENCYMRMTGLDKDHKQHLYEILMLKNKNKSTWDQYALLSSSKVAVNTGSTDEGVFLSLSTLLADELPDQMWSTKVKVGPTEYYAEVYHSYSIEYTICYTADGKPVYEFERYLREKQLISATLYETILAGSGTSKNLCALPSGFKTYSFDDDTYELTDAKGNVFTVVPQANEGFKVLDNTGKDVTADFKWAKDLLEMI